METFPHQLYLVIDSVLIFFFRLTEFPIISFLVGVFVLALLSVIAGELTVSVALKFNKSYVDQMTAEMLEKERLSMAAYQAGDKAGYKALNKEATDAWGKSFFTMVAHSAGILCPIPFALGWLHTRFADVDFLIAFPFSAVFRDGVGYTFIFIPMYILCRILFKHMRPYLPYFRGVQKMLDAAGKKNDPVEQPSVFQARPVDPDKPIPKADAVKSS